MPPEHDVARPMAPPPRPARAPADPQGPRGPHELRVKSVELVVAQVAERHGARVVAELVGRADDVATAALAEARAALAAAGVDEDHAASRVLRKLGDRLAAASAPPPREAEALWALETTLGLAPGTLAYADLQPVVLPDEAPPVRPEDRLRPIGAAEARRVILAASDPSLGATPKGGIVRPGRGQG